MLSKLDRDKDQERAKDTERYEGQHLRRGEDDREYEDEEAGDDVRPAGPCAEPVHGGKPPGAVAHGEPSKRCRYEVHRAYGPREPVGVDAFLREEVVGEERCREDGVCDRERYLRECKIPYAGDEVRERGNDERREGYEPERRHSLGGDADGKPDEEDQQRGYIRYPGARRCDEEDDDDRDRDDRKENVVDDVAERRPEENERKPCLDAADDAFWYPVSKPGHTAGKTEHEKERADDEAGGHDLALREAAGDDDGADRLHRFDRDRKPVVEPGDDEPGGKEEEEMTDVHIRADDGDAEQDGEDGPEVADGSGDLFEGEPDAVSCTPGLLCHVHLSICSISFLGLWIVAPGAPGVTSGIMIIILKW
ncbi:hypothetical protein DSECCO2_620490 [anaerobic digester metagenome]